MRGTCTPGEIFHRARLLALAFALILGGAMGNAGGIGFIWILLPSITVLLLAAVARLHGKALCFLVLAVLLVHVGVTVGFRDRSRLDGRRGKSGYVTLSGQVEVGNRGSSSGEVMVMRVEESGESTLARKGERYLFHCRDQEVEALRWGDMVEAHGYLRIFDTVSGGISGTFWAQSLEREGSRASLLLRAALAFRERVGEVTASLPQGEAALARGMVLGDYHSLGSRDLLFLRASGLIHICAASGLHVGMLVAGLLWAWRKLTVSRRGAFFLTLPLLLTYALATGLSIPVLRASLLALTAGASFLLGRDYDSLSAMGAAALVLFLRDSNIATSTSFQLSFAAALGVVLLFRPLGGLMASGRSPVAAVLVTTLAAQLAVAPVLLRSFGEISLLAPLSNILVLPLLPLLMGASLLGALFSWLWMPLARPFMLAAYPVARWTLLVARAAAGQRWAMVRLFPFFTAWMLIYYPALFTAFLAAGKNRRRARVLLVALVSLALIAGLQLHLPLHAAVDGASITFFDVGQGDSALVQAKSGAKVLVDGGKDEWRLEQKLRERDARYLDVVAVSHPEADHVGGLGAAFKVCGVGLILHPPLEEGEASGVEFFARAEEMGIPMRPVSEGTVIELAEMRLQVMAPPSKGEEGLALNDRSLVMKISLPGLEAVMPGDVEEAGEENLLRENAPGSVSCDLLKVPHHGGYAETGEDFFRLLRPAVAVISVGADNPYGHPASGTLEALRRLGCNVYRTDECGDIVIRVDGEGRGYWVECERGP